MKNKLLVAGTFALFSFFSTQGAIAQTTTQTLTANSGPLTYVESDFPSSVLNYPTQISDKWYGSFNETSTDRMFMHTFNFDVKKGCSVVGANFNMKVKSISSGSLPMNDAYGFVNNQQGIFSNKVWTASDSASQEKNISHNLATLPNNILNTMNDGKFSVYLQDDTAVKSVELKVDISCPPIAGGIKDVKGEHFQCYDVRPEMKLKETQITVQDQFGRDQLMLGQPIMLCNPSAKTHGKKHYKINDQKRHLVCYTIEKQRGVKTQKVQINNQFEGNYLQTSERRMFCAPSLKTHLSDKPIPAPRKSTALKKAFLK